MMRLVVANLMATSFDQQGQIVELALIETEDFLPTGKVLYRLFGSDLEISGFAAEASGLTIKDYRGKKPFADSAHEIRDFIGASSIYLEEGAVTGPVLQRELRSCHTMDLPSDQIICISEMLQAHLGAFSDLHTVAGELGLDAPNVARPCFTDAVIATSVMGHMFEMPEMNATNFIRAVKNRNFTPHPMVGEIQEKTRCAEFARERSEKGVKIGDFISDATKRQVKDLNRMPVSLDFELYRRFKFTDDAWRDIPAPELKQIMKSVFPKHDHYFSQLERLGERFEAGALRMIGRGVKLEHAYCFALSAGIKLNALPLAGRDELKAYAQNLIDWTNEERPKRLSRAERDARNYLEPA